MSKAESAIRSARRGQLTVTKTLPPAAPRDVLRSLNASQLKAYKERLIEGGTKRATVNRTIERQRAEGAQAEKRGTKKGLSAKYSAPLRDLFPEKFEPREVKVKESRPATIHVRATFHTSSNKWDGNIKLDLSPDQVALLAEAEDEDEFWEAFNSEEIYDFPECYDVTNVQKVKLSF